MHLKKNQENGRPKIHPSPGISKQAILLFSSFWSSGEHVGILLDVFCRPPYNATGSMFTSVEQMAGCRLSIPRCYTIMYRL